MQLSDKAGAQTVSEYLADAEQHLQRFELPLGARLTVVDLAREHWRLQIPKLQFFGIFIQCALCASLVNSLRCSLTLVQ